MRILIDEEDLRWDHAWSIVTNVFFYTNHTVLPVRVQIFPLLLSVNFSPLQEALEKWPVPMIEHVLPRYKFFPPRFWISE